MKFIGGNFMRNIFVLLLFYIPILALGIYSFILFIKLAHRGIRALDIYIYEKERNKQ
jgi:hypothetical protein